MAPEITQFVLAAQSADARVCIEEEASLRQLQKFLLLSSVLANDEEPADIRQRAGILLRNSLDAKDGTRKDQLVKQWITVDGTIKTQIKDSLLRTLGSSEPEARHTSAQVIAKVASIEIPLRQWPELILTLFDNMTQQGSSTPLKQATLESLGYVCKEISHQDLVQDEVNSVLTAVLHGMNQSGNSPEVHLAATKALYNALDLAKTNFEVEEWRNYIMRMVCDSASSKEVEIRQAAFECLVSIASTYYKLLKPYMNTLFQLTSNAVEGDEENVALRAIECWSSICYKEIELQEFENSESGDSVPPHFRFIEQTLPYLVPMLLETLLKQEEDQDQGNGVCNISMAGGSCLGLVARAVGDAIVPLVVPFLEANIGKSDRRSRQAATCAFGSILEGPTIIKLAPLMSGGLEFFLTGTKDEIKHVRDTSTWILCRIFELSLHPASNSVISPKNLPEVVAVLLEAIEDVPNVAEKVFGAIRSLAQVYKSRLSPCLTKIIKHLLAAAMRTDGMDFEHRSAAYETLSEVVRCSNIAEASDIVARLLPVIMDELGRTLELRIVSSDDREKQADWQASLCGVLQVIIQKLSSSDDTKPIIKQNSDGIMALFLKVLGCHGSSIHEEAMFAIGALAYAIGPEFGKHMPELFKYLQMGLQDIEEYQAFAVTAGVFGDICRALDDKVLPYCDQIIPLLIQDVQSNALLRSGKPSIFSCFGDIALAIGFRFERYIAPVLQVMQQNALACEHMGTTDEELTVYANQLRRSIFEAYSGILRGFKDGKAELILPYAQHLLQFVELVSRDSRRDERVTKAAVAAMGDLADALGQNTEQLFKNFTFWGEFLREGLQSKDERLKETAGWTQEMIGRVMV